MENRNIDESLRERILEDLSGHFAKDTLGIEEYEQRVQAVLKAGNNLELVRINEDILPAARYTQGKATAENTGRGMPAHHQVQHQQAVAIFSASSLAGSFDAPDKLDSVAIFGGCKIDLREARIPASGIIIEVAAIFGGVDMFLPQDCDFQVQVAAIFGGVNHPSLRRPSGRPMITIRGAAVFGGVDIKQG